MKRFLALLAVLAAALSLAVAVPATASAQPSDGPFEVLPPKNNGNGNGKPGRPGPKDPVPAGTGNLIVELHRVENGSGLTPQRANETWDERGRSVADDLQRKASASQQSVMAAIRGRGGRATTFWIRNTVVVENPPPGLQEQLAALPVVKSVREERKYPMSRPLDPQQAVVAAASAPEWGVAKVGAPAAWDRGVLGGGIVVGSIDTGVDYLHPAITQQYRGNLGNGTFDHNYNWYDASRSCPTADPCDLQGHGTHTMGTMVGGDGPGPFTPDIGVAPGARWMSAGCGPSFCTESEILAAAQFILVPFGDAAHPADPGKRPHIVNNSWGGPGGDPFVQDLVRAWRSAGMVPVFSAGNSGPECQTVGSPGDYDESYTVGATDPDDNIASFSSRGATLDGRAKPDISAPGVEVTSAAPGGGYYTDSGTSMAAPHVAGTIALALSAAPNGSVNVDQVLAAVDTHAVNRADTSCGGDADGDPNNVYGEGRIDAAATVGAVVNGGTLTGRVTVSSGAALGGARVTATGGGRTYVATTAADGSYKVLLPVGTYDLAAASFGFVTATRPGVAIARDQTVSQSFTLAAAPAFTVNGVVRSAEAGTALSGVTVQALGTPRTTVTDAYGRYSLSLPPGTYRIRATRGGCVGSLTSDVVITTANRAQDFRLAAKTDRFGHGCAPTAYEWTNARYNTGLTGDDALGRLTLPFTMPFYGQNYRSVYVATDGHLNFTEPYGSYAYNDPIPTEWDPNAGIYPLWQNLSVEGDASITWDRAGFGSTSRVVISFNRMRVVGTTTTVSFQVRLWATGVIDMIYDDMASPENGGSATIGIESPDGKDGLQFGHREKTVPSRTAWRYSEVTSGTIRGTVVDNNDGRPVAGATVTANPGGRVATTDANGAYEIKLIPGSYRLDVTARNYTAASVTVTPARGTTRTAATARLRTGIATVTPSSLAFTNTFGQTTEQTVTLRNSGSAPLTWTADDRGPAPTVPPGQPAPLRRILDDPVGDNRDFPVDLASVDASATSSVVSMAVNFSPETVMDAALGVVHFDVDQDSATGSPARIEGGLPEHDAGVEYVALLYPLHYEEPVVELMRTDTYETVGSFPGAIEGQTMRFTIPTSAFGAGEDGNMDTSVMAGTFNGPSDWAPGAGHGTIEVRQDAPWITESPASGTLAPGASVTIRVRGGSPTLPRGVHLADLRVLSDAGRVQTRLVPVRVTVT